MARWMMLVLWPSFLVAIVAEGFFFSFFDPQQFHFEMPIMAVYTLGFFGFWACCALASMLTCYLAGTAGMADVSDSGRRQA